MKNMRMGIPRLFKDGYKQFSGLEEAILKNIDACMQLSTITRTSFGPNGMNKIVINHIEKIFVTSDAATIINELQVQHPAAKILVLAAQMQEKEIGDGSNFVLVFAGELLKKAKEIIHMGVHPSDIIKGYEMAGEMALKTLQDLTIYTEKNLNEKAKLVDGVRAAISSKQFGLEDLIAPLVAEACLNAMPKNPANFIVDNIRVLKLLGGRIDDCHVVRGMALGTECKSNLKSIKDSKVLVATCSIDAAQTDTKGTVLIENASELMNYNQSEEDHIHKVIKGFHDMGVKVLITGEKVGDMALHFINKYEMMVICIFSKFNLRRICRTLRARPCVSLTGVREDDLGFAASISERTLGGNKIVVFEQPEKETSVVSTIVVRGSTNNVMNDLERAIDDGVNVVRQMTKDARFIAGAGGAEIELARRISAFGQKQGGLEQYSIKKYAEALEVVPRTLAENSGLDGSALVTELYAKHSAPAPEAKEADAEAPPAEHGQRFGIDVKEGGVQDMTQEGVMDLLATRLLGLRLATNAAVTILRVDHIIMKKPAGGPKKPKNRGHWDDNDDTW